MATVDYTLLKDEIAFFIGEPETTWDMQTSDAVESCIRTGVDRVIHNGLHQWSWMRPRWSMTTADGQRFYTLPSDFEQFVSDLYFDGVHYTYPAIRQLPASRLMQLQADSVTTGTPVRFAIEAVAHDGVTSEQDQQLVLHPTPDAAYCLVGMYQVGVRALSSTNPYPPGGVAHGELFVAACIAAAEAKFKESPETGKQQAFMEMLQNHIAIDLRRQARSLGAIGQIGKRMRGRADARRVFDLVSDYTTYNGTTDV